MKIMPMKITTFGRDQNPSLPGNTSSINILVNHGVVIGTAKLMIPRKIISAIINLYGLTNSQYLWTNSFFLGLSLSIFSHLFKFTFGTIPTDVLEKLIKIGRASCRERV